MSAFGGKGDDNMHMQIQKPRSRRNRQQPEQPKKNVRIKRLKKAASEFSGNNDRIRFNKPPASQMSLLPRTRGTSIRRQTTEYDRALQQYDTSAEDSRGGTESKSQEASAVMSRYTLSNVTLTNHILARHGPKSNYKSKSHFNEDFDITDGIHSTLTNENFYVSPNTAGREGSIYEQTFSYPIGKNSRKKPLYTLKVVIDADRNVITAFPT